MAVDVDAPQGHDGSSIILDGIDDVQLFDARDSIILPGMALPTTVEGFRKVLLAEQRRISLAFERSQRIVKEKLRRNPEVVLTLADKLSYFFSVFVVLMTSYLLCCFPIYLSYFYAFVLVVVVLIRFFMYKKQVRPERACFLSDFVPQKYQYFLLDFCYYSNALLIFHIFIFPESPLFFQICFCLCNGPLLVAIALWKNSLVLSVLEYIFHWHALFLVMFHFH